MKKKISLPKRSDTIYLEIENFEDYEYTNCIAYEMAIRNKEVKALLKEITNYPLYEYSPYEDKYYELDKKLEDTYFIDYKIREHLSFSYKVYIEKYHNDFCVRSGCFKSMQILKKEFTYNQINNLIEYEKKVNDYFYGNIEKIKFVYDKFTTEEDKIHNNSNPLFRPFGGFTHDGKFIEKEDEKKAIIESRRFLQFKRPRLSIPKNLDKTISIKINPNLLLEELKAYIEHLKKEYNGDNSIIKNPLELLGEDLGKADENLLIHKGTGKYNKYRVADMFFIYDGMKKRMKKAKIINELNYYYYDKNNKNTNYDYKTLDKYYEIATELIDNLKYKNL